MAHQQDTRPSLRLRLKRFTILAAYKQAVEQAEHHHANGHHRRAQHAQREADRLRSRLHALGGHIPPPTQLTERISAFTRPNKASPQDSTGRPE